MNETLIDFEPPHRWLLQLWLITSYYGDMVSKPLGPRISFLNEGEARAAGEKTGYGYTIIDGGDITAPKFFIGNAEDVIQ